MGSSGSGSFSDYSGKTNQTSADSGSSGGLSGEDLCRKAFSAGLEDIEQYQLFSTSRTVPASGTFLSLTIATRIVAVDQAGVTVGALPTRFNYIAACIRSGIQYAGVVQRSSTSPNARVDVDFAAV